MLQFNLFFGCIIAFSFSHIMSSVVNSMSINSTIFEDANLQKLLLEPPHTAQKPRQQRSTHSSTTDCEYYDAKTNSCWFERQIGESLTLSLNLRGISWTGDEITVTWQRWFKIYRDSKPEIVDITKDNVPWNLAIGSGGLELRISPITDTDMDLNSFKAKVYQKNKDKAKKSLKVLGEVFFRINVIPVEMGKLYPGEESIINIESYISLPSQSLYYEWFIEESDEMAKRPLPSNMRISSTGKTLYIREFRYGQEGVISCGIYSIKRLFVAKRRFRIRSTDNSFTQRESQLTSVERNILRQKLIQLLGQTTTEESYRRKRRTPTEQREQRNNVITKINPSYFYSKVTHHQFSPAGDENPQKYPNENILISHCVSKEQCSSHADCMKLMKQDTGYCKCFYGYHGNGLFCWEAMF